LGGVLGPTKSRWYHLEEDEVDTQEASLSGLGIVDVLDGGKLRFVLDLERLFKEEVKRQEVVFELITTEKEYVRDLQLIINVSYSPVPFCYLNY
jgi:hypothetical protein